MAQPPGPVPAAPGPPTPHPRAPVGDEDVSAVLSGPAFEAVVSILGELPLLHSTYSDALPARSTYKSLDAQPVHSLLDEANCLLRAITDEVEPHMMAALSTPHPLSSFSLTHEAADLLQAVDHVSGFHGDPSGLSLERHAIRSVLSRASAAARPLSARLHDLMSPSVRQVAGHLNVALLAAMGASIGFPDTSIAENFVRGFPVCGFVPVSDSPNFRAVPRDPDFPDIDGLDHVTHNSRMAARVAEDFSAGRSPHAQVLWDGSVGEVAKGYSQGPFSFAAVNKRFGAGNWRAMHAFAVEQVKPDGSVKYRRCDDAASSMHNACTSLGETITCDSADFPARVAALFADRLGLGGTWGMLGGTEDIEMAYRRCPCRTPRLTVVAQVNPDTGECAFFVVPGMNFGLSAAVNQFNRLPELVVAFLRRRCGISCTHYFDDYCVAEPDFAGRSGQAILSLIHALLGMPLAPSKSVSMRQHFVFLGVETDFRSFGSSRVILLRPKAGRVASMTRAIEAVFSAGFISYSLAATFRGKLQFILSTVGAGCRAVRSVLSAVASVRRGCRRVRTPQNVGAALEFVRAVLPHLPPRSIDLRRIASSAATMPVVVWSDAMWDDHRKVGGLGFVVFFPSDHPAGGESGRFYFAKKQVGPADLPFLSRDHHLIGQLELLAAVAVYSSFPTEFFRERDVVHYIDNTSALYSITKGYSRRPDSLAIIRAFHVLDMMLEVNVWFNYVASKANIADLPSRDAIEEMAEAIRSIQCDFSIGDSEVVFSIPPIPDDPASLAELWVAVASAVGSAPPAAQAPSASPTARPARHARAGKRRRG